jgi:hypothetical protein
LNPECANSPNNNEEWCKLVEFQNKKDEYLNEKSD